MKKILSLILSAALVGTLFSGLSGCGNKNSGKLIWQITTVGQTDEKLVYAEFNKRLEKLLPGVQVEFKENKAERWSQQLSAGEQIDIAWTGYTYNMQKEIENDSYLSLNDYISEKDTPNLWKEWKEDYVADYDTGSMGGKLYAIPNQQPLISETPYLKVPESCLQYFDLAGWRKAMDSSSTMTREAFEVLDSYFAKVWAANAYDTDTVAATIDINSLQHWVFRRGNAGLRKDDDDAVYDPFAENGEVKLIHKYETAAYALAVEYAGKWYEKGYIAKDVMINGSGSGARLSVLSAHQNGSYFNLTDDTYLYKEVKDNDGYVERYDVMVEPSDHRWGYLSSTILGDEATYLVVPSTSKYPEQAVKLIDLLRSPKGTEGNDLLNLLVYGFEKNSPEAKEYGTYHYELEGDLAKGVDYTLQPSAACKYGKPHWSMGNVFLTYRTPDIAEGQQEYALNFEKNVKPNYKKTPLIGFEANNDGLDTIIANMKGNENGEQNQLYCGKAGLKAPEMLKIVIKINRETGGDKLIANLQKQVDDYIAKNK